MAVKPKTRTRANGSKVTGKGQARSQPRRVRNKHELPDSDIRRRMRDNGVKNAEQIVFRNFEPQAETMVLQENGELTFTAVVASEHPVERVGYSYEDGRYEFQEILDMAGCNLERGSIIPMLRDHVSWKVENQIGDWRNFRIDPNDATKMLADGRIAADDDAKIVRERTKAGIIKTFSCAYTVDDLGPEEEGDNTRLRVTAWTMYEVSAVAVPADLECVIRGLGAAMKEERNMAVRGTNAGKGKGAQRGKPAPVQKPKKTGRSEDLNEIEDELEDEDQLEEELSELDGDDEDEDLDEEESDDDAAAERSARDALLRRRAKTLGMPKSFLRNYLGTSTTPQEMTRAYHARAAETRSRDTQNVRELGNPQNPIVVDNQRTDQVQMIVRAMAETERAASRNEQPKFDDEVKSILPTHGRGMSPRDVLRLAAKRGNVRLPQDLDMDAGAFMNLRTVAPHVIADFAFISNLVLTQLTLSAQDVYPYWGEKFTRRVEFTNFANGQFTTVPTFDELLANKPGAEVKAGGIGIFDTQGRLETFNRRYAIGRQLWTASGVGLFANFAQGIQNAGVLAENKLLQQKILDNPVMSDKVPFFHDSRYNVATNVPMTKAGIGKIQAMSGRDGAAIPFTMVIVNPVHMVEMDALAATITAARAEDFNPFGGKFVPIYMHGFPQDAHLWLVDPRLRAAFLRMVLQGQDVPGTKVVETAQYDGFELLAFLDRGLAHGDPRAAFLAFTGEEPTALPTPPWTPVDYEEQEANYEARDIDELLKAA